MFLIWFLVVICSLFLRVYLTPMCSRPDFPQPLGGVRVCVCVCVYVSGSVCLSLGKPTAPLYLSLLLVHHGQCPHTLNKVASSPTVACDRGNHFVLDCKQLCFPPSTLISNLKDLDLELLITLCRPSLTF